MHYCLNSDRPLLEKMEPKLGRQFPGLEMIFQEFPPAHRLTRPQIARRNQTSLEIVKRTQAKLVFVSLPSPEQETWIAQFSSEIPAVTIGMGRVFSLVVGVSHPTPRWLGNLGGEWLHQLSQNPRKLWGIYSHTIPT